MSSNTGSSTATPGATAEISAFGQFDRIVYSCEPTSTLWRCAYPRFAPYALMDNYVGLQGTASFGSSLSSEITRYGDLMLGLNFRYTMLPWLEGANVAGTFDAGDMNNLYAYANAFGYFGFSRAEFEVGGTVIDEINGDRMFIRDDMLRPEGKQALKMVGRYENFLMRGEAARFDQDLIVPLTFGMFLRPDTALESIAIFKQKFYIRAHLRALSQLIETSGTASDAFDLAGTADGIQPNGGSNLLTNAHFQSWEILLADAERCAITKTCNKIVHPQYGEQRTIAKTPTGATTLRERLDYNNGAILLFVYSRNGEKHDLQSGDATRRGFAWDDFTGGTTTLFNGVDSERPAHTNVAFRINGQERFNLSWAVLREYVPWAYLPRNPLNEVGVYTFTLHPVPGKPCGSLNLSAIDHQEITVATTDGWSGTTYIDMLHLNVFNRSAGTLTPVFNR